MGGCQGKGRVRERMAEIRSNRDLAMKEKKKKPGAGQTSRLTLSESDALEGDGPSVDGSVDKAALKAKSKAQQLAVSARSLRLCPDFDPEGEEAIRVEEVEMNRVINDAPLSLALSAPVNTVWVEIHTAWQNSGPAEMKAEFVGSAFPVDLKYVILPPLKKRRGPTAPKRLFPRPAQDPDGDTNEDEEKGAKKRKRQKKQKKQAVADESEDPEMKKSRDEESPKVKDKYKKKGKENKMKEKHYKVKSLRVVSDRVVAKNESSGRSPRSGNKAGLYKMKIRDRLKKKGTGKKSETTRDTDQILQGAAKSLAKDVPNA